MPASVKEASVLAGSEHVPALSARVTVTVLTEVDAVAEQLENPVGSVTAGEGGMLGNAGSKPTTILEPAPSCPVALEWRSTVHFVVAPALCTAPLNETGAGEVAAPMTTLPRGETGMASALVRTVKPSAV